MTDAMREALKPCPFCGESRFARVEQYMFPPDDGGPAWRWGLHVVCDASGLSTDPPGCGCSSSWGETETDAVAAWNRRALSTPGAAAQSPTPDKPVLPEWEKLARQQARTIAIDAASQVNDNEDARCVETLVEKLVTDRILSLAAERDAAVARCAVLERERDAFRNLFERVKNEAICHAMEARGANATIQKAYQAASGATGERGNWNGALPIIEALHALKARAEAAEARLSEETGR